MIISQHLMFTLLKEAKQQEIQDFLASEKVEPKEEEIILKKNTAPMWVLAHGDNPDTFLIFKIG